MSNANTEQIPTSPAVSAQHGPITIGTVVSSKAFPIALVIASTFVYLFFRWFQTQSRISVHRMEDWGHAFAIPLISGYLIWQKRELIARCEPKVFWPALVPFLVGILTYAYTLLLVSNHMLQGLALVLTLGSTVLLLTGPGVLRWLFLPIAYLVLMITISESIMLDVTFKLQLIASQGSWLILSLIGEPFTWFTVDLDGNTLEILTSSGQIHPLNVAEACSGMRMVVAFYALAGAVALLGCTQWWQRIALVLIAGPVAIFMNMIRVTVLGLLTLIDADLAAGDAHTLIGTVLLVPSLGLFMLIVWLLNRIVGGDEETETNSESKAGKDSSKGAPA